MSPSAAALYFAGQHDEPSQLFMCLKGVAASRGEQWHPRTIEEARRRVVDLATSEPEVQEQLAQECLRWATKR